MRDWQKPLNEEQIALLQKQFAVVKRRIEEIWGVQERPWKQNS